VNSNENTTRKRNLRSAYVRAPQFGLVLGAGVTAGSGVPTYPKLALRVLELASEEGGLSAPGEWVQEFVQRQRQLLREEDRKTVPPEEVVLFVRAQADGDEAFLRRLVKRALYEHTPARRTVGKGAFSKKSTLDAILTFCAARPDTVLAPVATTRTAKPTKEYDIEANIKVGGILTTNYDNLVEGAFHTKYRRNLLKPVGRPSSQEAERGRRLIPVYHIHGYIGYREPDYPDAELETPDIVVAEDDYFEAFYDPLGFGNYIAMSFLRRFPCLFIGSAMTDKNLRRFLFHLAKDVSATPPHQRKFAILKSSGSPEDELTDAILLSYGVETIWIRGFDEIRDILRGMYIALPGVYAADWEYLENYTWS